MIIVPASINERMDRAYRRGLYTGIIVGGTVSALIDTFWRFLG